MKTGRFTPFRFATLTACALAVAAHVSVVDALQRGRPNAVATGGAYRNQYFQFNYPPNWQVLYDGVDPGSPGFLLIRVFSPDDTEFAEVRYQLPGVGAEKRDFLYDTARAYGNRNGDRDSSFPAYEFREAFAHGGVKTFIRRMLLEPQAELFGSEIEAPGLRLGTSHYAHIIYKHNTNVPNDSTTSAPRGVAYKDLPAYAAAIAGRQQIMASFTFADAAARPAPSITGRWDGTNSSGLALDVRSDGTFVSLLHPEPGVYVERAHGTYEIRSGVVILRYVWPSQSTETCSDYRLTRDELAGDDVLVLCKETYRK